MIDNEDVPASVEGAQIKTKFEILKTLWLRKEKSVPNMQVIVERWPRKFLPALRRVDLRFWGEENEPGYAIRFSKTEIQEIIELLKKALEVK